MVDFQTNELQITIQKAAINELEKALAVYQEQKEVLKNKFVSGLTSDKENIKKVESRMSLLNTKITTIIFVLTQYDAAFLASPL